MWSSMKDKAYQELEEALLASYSYELALHLLETALDSEVEHRGVHRSIDLYKLIWKEANLNYL
jgi:hypothetical protein